MKLQQYIEKQSEGIPLEVNSPDGETLSLRVSPPTAAFRAKVDAALHPGTARRVLSLNENGSLEGLMASKGGWRGFAAITNPSESERDQALLSCAAGLVVLGWESDDLPDRTENGQFHAENCAALLSVSWVADAVLSFIKDKQSGNGGLAHFEAAVKKILSNMSNGATAGDPPQNPSRSTKRKPRNRSRRAKKPRKG